ncbi:uncharacterized protein LOC120993984 isoform X2 [Bufo bufo]|nr:uncharacterized protein LOC120993984 isoform X2 [Bufo bufo]XP_040278396.1 uncharacterized protein LOC120993984 isoform X2 [Bufo bufo]
MAASRLDVDEEILIGAVQQRSCIWDSRDVAYADRGQKNKAWDEVVTAVLSEWPSLSSSQQIIKRKAVQTRWRSLKDCYTWELRQIRDESGSSSSKRKQYIYFDQLDFLRPVLETRSTSGNLQRSSGPEADHGSSDEPPESTAEAPSAISLRRRRRRPNEPNISLSGRLSSLLGEHRGLMDDPNYHFSMFAFTVLKKLGKDKMDACRKELWEILNKYISMSEQTQGNPNNPTRTTTLPQTQFPISAPPNTHQTTNPHSQYNPPPADFQTMQQTPYAPDLQTNPYPSQYQTHRAQYSAPLPNTMPQTSATVPPPSIQPFLPQQQFEPIQPNPTQQTSVQSSQPWSQASAQETRPSSGHSTAAGSHSTSSVGQSRTSSTHSTPFSD